MARAWRRWRSSARSRARCAVVPTTRLARSWRRLRDAPRSPLQVHPADVGRRELRPLRPHHLRRARAEADAVAGGAAEEPMDARRRHPRHQGVRLLPRPRADGRRLGVRHGAGLAHAAGRAAALRIAARRDRGGGRDRAARSDEQRARLVGRERDLASRSMNGGPMVTMLLCVDGSDESRHAVVEAARLFAGARAVVLNVWRPFEAIGGGDALAGIATDRRLWDMGNDEAGAEAEEVVLEAAALAQGHGLMSEAAPRAMEKTVWETILDAAREFRAAVIVTGGRGLQGLHELVDGSLSHRLIQHSDRPVLVIPHSQP